MLSFVAPLFFPCVPVDSILFAKVTPGALDPAQAGLGLILPPDAYADYVPLTVFNSTSNSTSNSTNASYPIADVSNSSSSDLGSIFPLESKLLARFHARRSR